MALEATKNTLRLSMMPLFCCPTLHFRRRTSSASSQAIVLAPTTSAAPSRPQPGSAALDQPRLSKEEDKTAADLAQQPSELVTGTTASPATSASTYRPNLTIRNSSLLWTKPLPQIPPPDMPLSGKVALVTGGARGIGAAIAVKLAHEGARIAFTFSQSSSVSKAHAVIATIESLGSSATAIQADASQDPKKVISHVLKAFAVDKLDILVNNAGVALDATLSHTTRESYDRVFSTNARAVFFMMQAATPHLAPGARVVNLSASAARAADRGSMAFAGSKAAVEAFTRVAARELGELGTGITVNCVSPGMVRTEDYESIGEEAREEAARGTPAGERIGTVEDVADVVAFVVGDGARWITGSVIPVNGGKMMF